MVKVEYEDIEGRKFLVHVPEGGESMAEQGIPIGPPDLSILGMPLEYEIALNNQLFDRKLFTWADVRLRPDEIKAALKAVLKVDVQRIMNLYKEEIKNV